MTTHHMAWEDVLAQVEADVRSTEAALAAAATHDLVPRELAPAETMLPVAAVDELAAPGPHLPPLSNMPPVPNELLTRIVEVRARIENLRTRMQEEMRTLQAMTARIDTRPTVAAASAGARFVDRAL